MKWYDGAALLIGALMILGAVGGIERETMAICDGILWILGGIGLVAVPVVRSNLEVE